MSSELMIYCIDAINQVSTFGIQDTISYCVGDEVQTKNPEPWCTGVPGNETSGSKEVLSGLGIYCDWYRRRPYTFAHGNSAQIRSQHGCRDVKEKHEQAIKPEVSFPQGCVLGQRWDMVKRIFRCHSWHKRIDCAKIRSESGEGRHRTSAA